jgi:hypothetical protein
MLKIITIKLQIKHKVNINSRVVIEIILLYNEYIQSITYS